ncbi:MAG: phosphoesterase [Desulfamplus sp.]|nr:phosphoesterase [Desulfamplus sp.]
MEKVLCIKRADIPSNWLKDESSIKMGEDIFFSAFLSHYFAYYWLDRPVAEKDSSFKQIIPYIVIQSDNGNITAIYRRKGSESRLHGLWSIGIGGHINPLDISLSNIEDSKADLTINSKADFKQILYSGMIREFNEEIISKPEYSFKPEFMGIINEELTDVGKVHFGVVFKIEAGSCDDFVAGEELVDFQWVKTESLLTDRCTQFNLELWSKMAIKLL